ncbi:MAG: UDP-N-acetylmuramate--L-alanine ligase [Candidatus Gallimonas sp.]
MIGIGGVSMSALARLLRDGGFRVRGSDACDGETVRALRREGIPVSIGENEAVSGDVVVYTGAVREDHPQLTAARKAGKRLLTRAELLGAVAEEFPHVLSVAGCHGKTSCTCMLAHVFRAAGKPFTSHVGGEDLLLGNYHAAGREYFLTEACEYRRSFLSLKSECAIVLNVDRDHMDCYRDEEDLFDAFRTFAGRAKRAVVNADDPRARRIPHAVSFGLSNGEIRAERLQSENEKYSFTVTEGGIPLVRVKLNVVGSVFVTDALAAFAAARCYGLTAEEIARGLQSFRGVKRRFEQVGTFRGVPVVCDYAHHPREMSAALRTARSLCGGRVRLVFQPHTYSRTKDLADDFVAVLKEAGDPIVYKTYAAREPFDGEGSAYALVARVPEAVYVQTPEQLRRRLLQSLGKDDLILALGAGDIYRIVKSIL